MNTRVEKAWQKISIIREIKYLTGLEWADIATMANLKPGEPLKWIIGSHPQIDKKMDRLDKILELIRYVDDGNHVLNQSKLYNSFWGDDNVFSMIKKNEFARAREFLGAGAKSGRSHGDMPTLQEHLDENSSDSAAIGEALAVEIEEMNEFEEVDKSEGDTRITYPSA